MTTSRMQRFLLMLALLVAPVTLMLSCGGNATAPAVSHTYNPAPAVVISGATTAAATGPVTFTFTFSQPVTTFPATAVNVTNGSGAANTTKLSANQYTLVITPSANSTGIMTVAVAAHAFSSASGEWNTAAASVTQTYDTRIVVVATLPVFTDNYAAGLSFVDFGGATNAITVDTTEHHSGTASLKMVVPATNYTGGAIVSSTPKDLSGYTAVTFWVKASVAGVLDVAGLGNNANGGALYSAESTQIPVTTAWVKYTLPIPVPAKATAVDGLFHFAKGSGQGAFTIWLDDIQYENLTGASAPTATGVTVTWSPIPLVAGATSQLNPGSNTIAYSFPVLANNGNLFNVGWGYFTLDSSNKTVATVDPTGLVTAKAAGTTNITGAVGSLVAPGQSVITVSGSAFPTPATLPPVPAPPTGSSVISLYASQGGFTGSTVVDKHTNVQTWLTSWSGGTGGTLFPITVGAATANPRLYTMTNSANYVGISLVPDDSTAPPNIVITNEIDISAMTHFHVDFWTPDEATNLQFKLVDGGADGQINPGYNGILLLTPTTTPALATGHWVSCDVPIANSDPGFAVGGNNFPGGNATSLKHFAQLVIVASGGGHVYVDNLYFWGSSGGGGGGTATAPTAGAGAPSVAAANVISLYNSSHTYTDVPVNEWNPNWGQSGSMADFVAGSATVKKLDLVAPNAYQGVAISSNGGDAAGTGVLNITGKTTLHISYWTANGTKFNFYPINATAEVAIDSGTLTQGAWTDLELIVPSSFDPTTIRQIKFDTSTAEVIYLDNIYFHAASSGGGGGGIATSPTAGAGAPSVAAASVISLYNSSHTYTDVTVTDWNPNWGQSGSLSDLVAGSATVKKLDLVAPNAYQGVAISSNGGDAAGTGVLNITGKTTLHISYWTANGTKFNFYPINATAEVAIDSGTLTHGAWTDLELAVPSGFNPTTIRQLKFDTTTAEVIYLDNIYFH